MAPLHLVIQIPCYNEEATLAKTMGQLPKSLEGISKISVLIIDDGSRDRTAEVAQQNGATEVICLNQNRGLANAFRVGLDRALEMGADVIVNTDADNQYFAGDIEKLVRLVIEENYDMVIGDRQTYSIAHFSPLKKFLQNFGSYVVRSLSGTDIRDATSGFRAFSRHCAMNLNIVSRFSYTIETIIQGGKKQMKIGQIPIRVNPGVERPSRLFKSMPQFIKNSVVSMLRIYVYYEPLKSFFYVSGAFAMVGMIPFLRFFYSAMLGNTAGRIQSLIFGSVLLNIAFLIAALGVIGDMQASNRKLLEGLTARMRKMELRDKSNSVL